MTDIIDINAERNKREQPDSRFVRRDNYGRPLYCFLLSYMVDESRFSTQVWAYDFADAEARVAAMRNSLKVDGQLFKEIPA